MGAPELREIIAEHRPLDVTAPYAWPVLALALVYFFVLYGVKPEATCASTWLLPLVWLALTFSRCRHASLFAVTTVVAVTAMWKHTRWALYLKPRTARTSTSPVQRLKYARGGRVCGSRPRWCSSRSGFRSRRYRCRSSAAGGRPTTRSTGRSAGSSRRAEGERAETGRAEQVVQLGLHRRRVRDLPRAGLQGVRGRPLRGVRRAVAEGLRRARTTRPADAAIRRNGKRSTVRSTTR